MRFVLLLLLTFGLMAAIRYEQYAEESSLLRGDPDSLPSDPKLMAFALKRGGPLFQIHCAICHGAAGQGDPNKGVPDLTDGDWLYGTGRAIDIQQVVMYGIRSFNTRGWNLAVMPAYATPRPSASNVNIQPLSPSDIRDLIEWLYHEQGRDTDQDATARGSAVYNGRGACWDCHGSDLKGDPAIGAPNLIDRVTLYGDGSKDSLFNSIALGRHGHCPAWAGKMNAAEVLETALYTYSLSHSRAAVHDES